MTVKDLRDIKINSANPLYVIVHKVNGYIEEKKEKKYFMLVPTDERKDTLKKHE